MRAFNVAADELGASTLFENILNCAATVKDRWQVLVCAEKNGAGIKE